MAFNARYGQASTYHKVGVGAQEQRQWFVSNAVDEIHARFPTTYAVMTRDVLESLCALPLLRGCIDETLASVPPHLLEAARVPAAPAPAQAHAQRIAGGCLSY